MSYKGKITALLSLFGISLAGMIFAFFEVTNSTQRAMNDVYYSHSRPVVELSNTLRELYDIRFRMTAYAAGILPAAGCLDHLTRSRDLFRHSIISYLDSMKHGAPTSDEMTALLNLMPQGLNRSEKFFDRMVDIYERDEQSSAIEAVEEYWPIIHSELLTPLNELYKMHDSAVGVLNNTLTSRNATYSKILYIATGVGLSAVFTTLLLGFRLYRNYLQHSKHAEHNSRLASLGEMAGGIAHEINSPLVIVTSRARQISILLTKDPLDKEKIQTCVASIEKTGHRIAAIVKGMQASARNSSEDPLTPFTLNEIIADTLVISAERSKRNGIDVRTEIPQEELALMCRPSEISQVLINLLNNAVDEVRSIDEGSPERWVKLAVVSDGNEVLIDVSNSGSLISDENRKKLFQPFFTTKGVGKGTGLGLSISRKICEAHGGKLYCLEKTAHTTFRIILPFIVKEQGNLTKSAA